MGNKGLMGLSMVVEGDEKKVGRSKRSNMQAEAIEVVNGGRGKVTGARLVGVPNDLFSEGPRL
jgi:hypothetical protein